MKKINLKVGVLSPDPVTPNGIAFITPLIIWKNKLRQNGIFLNFYNKITTNFLENEIAMVDSKFHKFNWEQNTEKTIKEFEYFKNNFNKLIYFDTTDSSGSIQTELLDIVDIYCKNQLLKERNKYLKPQYGMRIFSDYYHKIFNVDDNTPEFSKPVKNKENLKKLKLGWNSGFATYSIYTPILNKLYLRLKIKKILNFKNYYKKPSISRSIPMQARFGIEYNKKSIRFQREKIREKISNLFNSNKLNRYQYFQELMKTWSVLSPFGFGEITLKDFETFISGSLLIKPDMDHLETWPDFYEKNKTYVPVDWSLNDLEHIISDVTLNREKYIDVAIEGQNRYRSFLSSENSSSFFCNHLKKILLN